MKHSKNIRVYITENCNAQCKNCFNAGIRSDAEIEPAAFEKLCSYLIDSGFRTIKIMGGEPTVHARFFEIMQIAQFYFRNVRIFTNAINDTILNVKLRKSDGIIYNLNFLDTLTKDKLCLDQPGKRTLKIQINGESSVSNIIETITRLRKYDSTRIIPSFTLDCMSNIFDEQTKIIDVLHQLEKELTVLRIPFGYDHKIPVCFTKGTTKTIRYPSGLCRVTTAGIIDSQLNIRYCNQYNNLIINLLNGNEFIPWNIIKNYLLKAFYEQQIQILDNGCIKCTKYGDICNGGCWGKKINGLVFDT